MGELKFTSRMLHAVVATFFAVTLAPCVPAQQGVLNDFERGRCNKAEGNARRECQREIEESLSVMASLWEPAGWRRRWPESRLPLALIREDFTRLQAVSSYLARAVSEGSDLNLKAVAKSASEIKKRAGRLRNNLALPEPVDAAPRPQAEHPAESARLRASLSTLSSLVGDAVHNPVFRGYVFDPPLAAKARRDLDEIVELSERVRKDSERLSHDAR